MTVPVSLVIRYSEKIYSTQWPHLNKEVFGKCFLCGHLGACPLHVTLFLMVPSTSPDHV